MNGTLFFLPPDLPKLNITHTSIPGIAGRVMANEIVGSHPSIWRQLALSALGGGNIQVPANHTTACAGSPRCQASLSSSHNVAIAG